jgi:hypothetical protein
MQEQLAESLASLPFQMRPIDDSNASWRSAFTGDEPLNRYFYFELTSRERVPDWIIGLDKLRMSGSWRVFLPSPSPELTLVQNIISHNHTAAELARLESYPASTISTKRDVISDLQRQIEESLRQIAA